MKIQKKTLKTWKIFIRMTLQHTAYTETFPHLPATSSTKHNHTGKNDRNVRFIFVNLNITEMNMMAVLSASFSSMSQSNAVLFNLNIWLLFRNC